MPDPLPPPIFIEEARPAPPAIEGVSTSTAGMLGMTERGPETPQLVTGMHEFESWYGRFIAESYLPDAIRGFFDNGGQRCVVSRVVGVGATAASLTGGTYTWLACGRGAAAPPDSGALSAGRGSAGTAAASGAPGLRRAASERASRSRSKSVG